MCFPLCLRRHCCFIQISRGPRVLPSFPTRRSSDLFAQQVSGLAVVTPSMVQRLDLHPRFSVPFSFAGWSVTAMAGLRATRSEEHTSELQSRGHLVCRLLLEKKKRHDGVCSLAE